MVDTITDQPFDVIDFMLFSLVVNCWDPMPPVNGALGSYPHTREGSSVTYMCNMGYKPSTILTSTCESSGRWTPAPHEHTCILLEGSKFTQYT